MVACSTFDDLKIKGMWFEPDTPDKKILGTLNGEELETFQISGSAEYRKSRSNLKTIPILYGIGQKDVTLTDVFQTRSESNWTTTLVIVTSLYHDAILDIHYKKSDMIKTLSFAYPFVWGPFMRKNPEDVEYGAFYEINETVNMDKSTKLKIGQKMESNFKPLEQKTTQSEFFKIEIESGIELDKMMEYLKSINHFLRLCMGETVFPKYIQGTTTNSKNFKYYPYWLTNYHRNNEFKNLRMIDYRIIRFHDLKDNFEKIIQTWTKMWFHTSEIMTDFFNIFESNMSLHIMFIELSHVIQRFCGKYGKGEENFRDKIKWFLGFCPEQIRECINKDNFVDKIVNTRNYNVHGSVRKEEYVIEERKEMIYLTDDLKSITEIFLISHLPIDCKTKTRIMEKIYKFNSYARTNPTD